MPLPPNLPAVLTFDGADLSIIDRDGRPWITAADLARALGYARADSVSRIYERNADEFSEAMSLTVNLTVKGFGGGNAEKPVRVFSARGAHLVAMLSDAPKAKAFRRWVLDVLDRLGAEPAPQPVAADLVGELCRLRSGIDALLSQVLAPVATSAPVPAVRRSASNPPGPPGRLARAAALKLTPEIAAEVGRLHRDGYSVRQIGKHLDLNFVTVARWIRRGKIKPPAD